MRAPDAVIHDALSAGAHQDCIAAGPDAACARCGEIMMEAFDRRYGNVAADRLRTVIAADTAAEGGFA